MTWRAVGEDGQGVAIKEIPLRSMDAKRRELVHREARVLASLDHPRVPRLREHLELGIGRDRALYLIQDLIEGETLEAEARGRRYTEAEVCEVVADLAAILADLHDRRPRLVHRDVKPANVLRRPDGALVLVDFGAVRDVVRDRDLGGSTVAGTFGYMAPEQFRGDASPATDLFGLGALAVRLLTRREPHTLQDYDQRMRWRSAVHVHPALGALLDGLLEPDQDLRLADARRVSREARALASRLQSGAALSGAPRVEVPERAPELLTRRRVDESVQDLLSGVSELREGRVAVASERSAQARSRVLGSGWIWAGLGMLLALGVGGGAVVLGRGVGEEGIAAPFAQASEARDRARLGRASRWAIDAARAIDASGVCDDAGGNRPVVVPLRISGGRIEAPGPDLTPLQACWVDAAAARGTIPPGGGEGFWLVPGGSQAGPRGVRLPGWEDRWLDPRSGTVRDGAGDVVTDALGGGG